MNLDNSVLSVIKEYTNKNKLKSFKQALLELYCPELQKEDYIKYGVLVPLSKLDLLESFCKEVKLDDFYEIYNSKDINKVLVFKLEDTKPPIDFKEEVILRIREGI